MKNSNCKKPTVKNKKLNSYGYDVSKFPVLDILAPKQSVQPTPSASINKKKYKKAN